MKDCVPVCVIIIMIPYIYRTFKQDCEAKIKLCLSKDYQKLVVSEVNLEHNHIVDKVSNTVPPNYICTLTCIPYLNTVATIGLVSKLNVASNRGRHLQQKMCVDYIYIRYIK